MGFKGSRVEIERIYVGKVCFGSDWGSFFEALAILLLSAVLFSLCATLLSLSAEPQSSFSASLHAFEAKKDLFRSRVFWGFSHKAIHSPFPVLQRDAHLILPPTLSKFCLNFFYFLIIPFLLQSKVFWVIRVFGLFSTIN